MAFRRIVKRAAVAATFVGALAVASFAGTGEAEARGCYRGGGGYHGGYYGGGWGHHHHHHHYARPVPYYRASYRGYGVPYGGGGFYYRSGGYYGRGVSIGIGF